MTLRLHSKRKTLIAILSAVIAGSLLLAGVMSVKASDDSGALLTVNGQEITAAEFNWHLQLSRALTADYFMQTYDARYSENFWHTGYSGEIPLQRWIKASGTQLLTKRMELQLAQEAGVVTDISFKAFLEGMERENKRRSQAAANKEVVYGPLRLDEQAYYSYYMSNLENAAIEAMRSNGSIAVSAAEVMAEYEANLDAKYSLPGAIRLEWATLPYGPESGYKDQSSAMERMEMLRAAAGTGLAESAGSAGSAGTGIREQAEEYGVYVDEVSITSVSRRTAALENPRLLLAAEQLAPGEMSSVFAENGAIHLLYCLSAEEANVQPLDQVKEAIALNLAQQKFRSIVDDRLSEASVEWNYPMAEGLANRAIQ